MGNAVVVNESDLQATGDPGNTVYDAGFPINQAYYHGTDQAYLSAVGCDNFVQWSEIDYEIGGETGAVDRNAYVLNGIDNYSDAHDFRGDHIILPDRTAGGGYGDAGNSDDGVTSYAQGVAAQGYPDISREQSWADISGSY